MTVEIYTDGGCRGNPGPGGWGVLLRYGPHEKEIYGSEPDTTNNRMELMAAIEGLRALKRDSQIILMTDSEYLRRGITEWINYWSQNNWRTKAKKPVKNADLWQLLLELTQNHTIEWRWVKGHSGHIENDRVDALANKAIDELIAKNRD